MALARIPRRLSRSVRLLPRRLTAASRPLPDFVIIGAQKAGTTSVFNYLGEHPDIVLSRKKEVHYFDLNFRRSPSWYRSHFPTEFDRKAGARQAVSGEATPYYLLHPLAPARMAATMPEIRVVVLLRNPVDRAYSHYQHEVDFNRETLSFEDAIGSEDARLSGEIERMIRGQDSEEFRRHSYLARGRYAEQLENWFGHLNRQQVLIGTTEFLQSDPQTFYSEVLRFLHLDDRPLASFPRHFSRSYLDMSPQTRDQLLEYFRPYNEKLYSLIDIDVDWNR